ncbi:hypothetical protein AB1Y20_007475 [Prymnesium parvum]|uniref:Uncharacterized protein n=1 Tax=Prymnesium parvum TaxID=97485 RepID=A0AB34IX57_PRYPA
MAHHPLAALHSAALDWRSLALLELHRRASGLGLAWRLSQQIAPPLAPHTALAVGVLHHARTAAAGGAAVGLPWLRRRLAGKARRRMLAAAAARGVQSIAPAALAPQALLLANAGVGGAQLALYAWQRARRSQRRGGEAEALQVFMYVQSASDGLCLQPSSDARSLVFDSCDRSKSTLWQWHAGTRRLASGGWQLHLRETSSAARLCLDRWCVRCLARGGDAASWAWCSRESEPVALLPRLHVLGAAWRLAVGLAVLLLAALLLWRRARTSSPAAARASLGRGDSSVSDKTGEETADEWSTDLETEDEEADGGWLETELMHKVGSWLTDEERMEAFRWYLQGYHVNEKIDTITENLKQLAILRREMLGEILHGERDDIGMTIPDGMAMQEEMLQESQKEAIAWSLKLFGDCSEESYYEFAEDLIRQVSDHPDGFIIEEEEADPAEFDGEGYLPYEEFDVDSFFTQREQARQARTQDHQHWLRVKDVVRKIDAISANMNLVAKKQEVLQEIRLPDNTEVDAAREASTHRHAVGLEETEHTHQLQAGAGEEQREAQRKLEEDFEKSLEALREHLEDTFHNNVNTRVRAINAHINMFLQFRREQLQALQIPPGDSGGQWDDIDVLLNETEATPATLLNPGFRLFKVKFAAASLLSRASAPAYFKEKREFLKLYFAKWKDGTQIKALNAIICVLAHLREEVLQGGDHPQQLKELRT